MADTDCPVPSQGYGASELAQLLAQPEASADWLAKHQMSCLRMAAYYRALGAVHTQLGNIAQALEATERALLHDPDHPETLLNYALLLASSGDTDAAQALFAQVLARPDAPPTAAALFRGLQQDKQAAYAALRQASFPAIATQPASLSAGMRWAFVQSLGRSTNLNSAPSASQLTFTFPQGNVTLPLADSGRPVDGMQAHSQFIWGNAYVRGAQAWIASAALTQRQTSLAAARATQAEVAGVWMENTEQREQFLAFAGSQWASLGRSTRSKTHKFGAGREWSHSAPTCKTSALVESVLTQQPHNDIENGGYKGISLGYACPRSFSLQWRGGQDTPQNADRAGGVQTKTEWVLQTRGNWGGGQWGADYTRATQQDRTGYSPLLEQGARRRLVRQSLRLEWLKPIGANAEPQRNAIAFGPSHWFVALERSEQRSNLALFATRSTALNIGLKWQGQ